MRRVLTFVTLVAFLAACTSTVEVPRGDIAASAGQKNRRGWQIDTRSGERYFVKNYQLTDSTLVLGELKGNDDFYGRYDDVPEEIPMSNVAKVSRLEMGPGATALLGASIFVGVLLTIIIVAGPPAETL